MLDSDSQKKIISKFYATYNYKKIDIRKIDSFSGQIEIIRRIRNIVNHYEPIFPLLSFEIKRVKKIENSPLYMTFELLQITYASSLFNDVKADVFKIEENHHPDEGEDETDGILTEKRTSETEEKDASENQPIGQNEGEPAGTLSFLQEGNL